MTSPAVLTCLLWCWLLAAEQPVDGVAATVAGEAIPDSEVDRLLKAATERDRQQVYSRDEIILMLVRRRVLEQQALEKGVTVLDEQLYAVIDERVEQAGGRQAYLAWLARDGLTPEQDREHVRRSLLAERYVDECLGLVPGSPLLRPHLALLPPTPAQVRAFYHENQDHLRELDVLTLAMVFVAKDGFDSPAEARNHALELRGQVDRLKEAAMASPEAVYREIPLRKDAAPALRDDVETFLETAPVGVISPVLETERGFLLAVKQAETPGQPLAFTDVQEPIRRHLFSIKRAEASRELIDELLATADIWPPHLRPRPPEATDGG